MFAHINHMAIISNQYPYLQKYYQTADPDGTWIDVVQK